MKRLNLLVSLFFILLLSTAHGQLRHALSGSLKGVDGAVPFATVLVKSTADSSVVKFGLTDSLGKFRIPGVPSGEFFISASMVGLADYNSESFQLKEDLDLGEQKMETDDKLMNEVVVLKMRPIIEVLPDKTVFNVENTINATGANGFDLLRKAPGVIIDNSNNIILEGKTGVQIYLDNKPSVLAGEDLVNFLKALQASDIDKIEIITQPSSKFDAAGNAGIINIVLKRDKRLGTNGTLAVGYGYGENHRMNSSASINHRNKVSNIYASYSNGLGANSNSLDISRLQEGVYYNSSTYSTTDALSHNGRVGADFFLGTKHTIGILGSGSWFSTDTDSDSETQIIQQGALLPDQYLIANNILDGQNYQVMGNLNYRFEDTLGHEFSVDADYGVYNRAANNYQPNEYFDSTGTNALFSNNYRMITPTDISILTAKADYAQYLLGGKISVGGKFSLVNTDNSFDFFDIIGTTETKNVDRSNDFFYRENINAGYVNYARKLGKKWNLQLGLRVENTISKGELVSTQNTDEDTVSRNYTDIFPSGGLTWTPNYSHIWSLTYSRRIQRPNYQNLNPFEGQISELAGQKGNPFLQPQYVQAVRLSHTFKYRFTTAASYSYATGFFAQITDTIGTNKTVLTSKNVADNQVITLTASLPFQIKPWWSVFISVTGYNTSFIQADPKFVEVDRWIASLYAQNTFILKGGFKFEISGWWNSPSIWGGTYLTKAMGSLDMAIEKKFLQDRMSLRIAASDILYTAPWKADLEYSGLIITGSGAYESRRFNIQLTYNFGNKDVKKIRDRKTGLEDEKDRVGG